MKSWNDVTLKEIDENKAKKCKYCEYLAFHANTITGSVCDYIGIEGKSRGCSPLNCDKFKLKRGAML